MSRITKEMIDAAEKAYASKRNPARWDGEPWGLAGMKNHREAIKACLRAAKNVGGEKSDGIISGIISESEANDVCDICHSGLMDYPEINRRTCSCGRMGYNVTDGR